MWHSRDVDGAQSQNPKLFIRSYSMLQSACYSIHLKDSGTSRIEVQAEAEADASAGFATLRWMTPAAEDAAGAVV